MSAASHAARAKKTRAYHYRRRCERLKSLVLTGALPRKFTGIQLIDLRDELFSDNEVFPFLDEATRNAVVLVVDSSSSGRRKVYEVALSIEEQLPSHLLAVVNSPKHRASIVRSLWDLGVQEVDGSFVRLAVEQILASMLGPQEYPTRCEPLIVGALLNRGTFVMQDVDGMSRMVLNPELTRNFPPQPSSAPPPPPAPPTPKSVPVNVSNDTLSRLRPLYTQYHAKVWKTNAAERYKGLGFPTSSAFSQSLLRVEKLGMLVDEGRGKWRWDVEKVPAEWTKAEPPVSPPKPANFVPAAGAMLAEKAKSAPAREVPNQMEQAHEFMKASAPAPERETPPISWDRSMSAPGAQPVTDVATLATRLDEMTQRLIALEGFHRATLTKEARRIYFKTLRGYSPDDVVDILREMAKLAGRTL